MIILAAPIVVLIVGLLMFAFAKTNQDVKKIGFTMFFCGLLVGLLLFGEHAVKLL